MQYAVTETERTNPQSSSTWMETTWSNSWLDMPQLEGSPEQGCMEARFLGRASEYHIKFLMKFLIVKRCCRTRNSGMFMGSMVRFYKTFSGGHNVRL